MGGGGRREGSGWGSHVGRIEVFGQFHKKKNWGGGGGVVRVDLNEELKFL